MNTFDELVSLMSDDFRVDGAAIDLDSDLANLGLDSLELVDLLFTVEEHFGVDMPADTSRFRTLRQLVRLIDDLRLPLVA